MCRATTLRAIVRTVDDLGGATAELLTDPDTALVNGSRADGSAIYAPDWGDTAALLGTRPRACRPYRAKTKGKVERFIGYLKRSFWVPFVATQRQAGVVPDKHSANAAVARWLREVANARVHATTDEVPADRLMIETSKLQDLPAAYRGRTARMALAVPERKHVIGYQHPLSVYDELAFGPTAPGTAEVVT